MVCLPMLQHLSIAHIAVTNIEPDHVNGEVFLKQSRHSQRRSEATVRQTQIGGKKLKPRMTWLATRCIERQRPDEATKGLSDRAERRLTNIRRVLVGSKHL